MSLGTLIRGDVRPDVPDFKPVDAQQQQKVAIRGNTSALPDAEKLAAQVNQFNWDQIDKGLESQVPDYRNILTTASRQIDDWLHGKLSDDTVREIQRRMAESSYSRGVGGSSFADFGTARTIGLTSLDLIQKGLASANAWLSGAASRRPMFDVTSMFLTPQQQIAHAVSERDKEFQRDWMQNQISAMPGPVTEAFAELGDYVSSLGQMAGSMGMSKAIGGGGGGGGGAGNNPYGNYKPGTVSGPAANLYSSPGQLRNDWLDTFHSEQMAGADYGYSMNPSPGGGGYSADFYDFGPQ